MFQSKFTNAHPGPGRDLSTPGPQDGLRAITWPELRVQMEAAREFRSAIGGTTGLGASFAHRSANRIATRAKSECGINFVDSADGKPASAISCVPMKGAARDDRESK